MHRYSIKEICNIGKILQTLFKYGADFGDYYGLNAWVLSPLQIDMLIPNTQWASKVQ